MFFTGLIESIIRNTLVPNLCFNCFSNSCVHFHNNKEADLNSCGNKVPRPPQLTDWPAQLSYIMHSSTKQGRSNKWEGFGIKEWWDKGRKTGRGPSLGHFSCKSWPPSLKDSGVVLFNVLVDKHWCKHMHACTEGDLKETERKRERAIPQKNEGEGNKKE